VLEDMGGVDGVARGLRQREAAADVAEVDIGRVGLAMRVEAPDVGGVEGADDGQVFEADADGGVEVQPLLGRAEATAVLDMHLGR